MKRSRTLALGALLVLALAAGGMILIYWILPRRAFEKAVLNPIPPSVKDIKSSSLFTWGTCYTYVLRFHIGAEDVPLILDSDRFSGIGYVKYSENGTLWFRSPIHGVEGGFTLFTGWRAHVRPPWCECDKWGTFRAYCVEREGPDFHKVLLFLHDPDHNQAYFINYQIKGN